MNSNAIEFTTNTGFEEITSKVKQATWLTFGDRPIQTLLAIINWTASGLVIVDPLHIIDDQLEYRN